MRQTCLKTVQNWPRPVDMWDAARLVGCWQPPNNVTRCLECAVRAAPGVGCVIPEFEAIWRLEGPMREAVIDARYACEVNTPGIQSEGQIKWSQLTCRHCSAPSAAQTLACLKALAQEPEQRQLVAYCYTTFTGQAVQQCLGCARDMQARFGGDSHLVCRPWRASDAPVLWQCLAGASTQQAFRACALCSVPIPSHATYGDRDLESGTGFASNDTGMCSGCVAAIMGSECRHHSHRQPPLHDMHQHQCARGAAACLCCMRAAGACCWAAHV